MGQAKRRGDFEERKRQSLDKKKEHRRIDNEAYLKRQSEFSNRNRRGKSILMTAMLAAFAGMDTGYRR